MEKFTESFDASRVEWQTIKGNPDDLFKIHYDYSLLGYDLASGKLDMLLRFHADGGHCERHHHVAATTTLVLSGEQHLAERQVDGSTVNIIRRAGDYALATNDALPHVENGGPAGGVVLLSMQTDNGILFRFYDENNNSVGELRIDAFVQGWNNRQVD